MRTKLILVTLVRVVFGGVSIFSVLTGLLILYEGISVGSGLVSDSDYHFGTDVFEAKGGWAYRSRRDYVASSVIEGTPFLVGGATGLFAALRGRLRLLGIGGTLIAAGVFAIILRLWCTESWFLVTHQFCSESQGGPTRRLSR